MSNTCESSKDPVGLGVTLRCGGLTTREMRALIMAMPEQCTATVTRQPVVLGGRRFAVEIAGLSIAKGRDIVAALHEHVENVANPDDGSR